MDKAAAAFGLDTDEIRRRNLIKTFPYTSVTGMVFDEGTYVETLDQAVAHIDLKAFRARTARSPFAAAAILASASRHFPSAPATAVRPSPRAAWRSRRAGKPSRSPWTRRAWSKRALARARTARGCALRLRKSSPIKSASRRSMCASSMAIPTARPMAGARSPAARWSSPAAPRCWRREDPQEAPHHRRPCSGSGARRHRTRGRQRQGAGTDRTVTIASLARAAYHQTHQFKGEITPGLNESADYDPPGTFSNACHAAIVEVDIATGRVTIAKISSRPKMPAASSIR